MNEFITLTTNFIPIRPSIGVQYRHLKNLSTNPTYPAINAIYIGVRNLWVTHMQTASLGLPALMNSASASSNLPNRDRRAATHDKKQNAIMAAVRQEEVKVKSNREGSHPYLILHTDISLK